MITGKIEATLEGASMAQHVTGSGNMNVSLAVGMGGHDASPTSLFRTAQDFLKAAEILDPAASAAPFGFVAAQCLELALKTYLLKAGISEEELRRKFSHDLGKAWLRCVTEGLDLEAAMPTWAAHLDAGHDSPYLFRYGRNNTGIVLSPKDTVLNGLRGVLAAVQAATGVT